MRQGSSVVAMLAPSRRWWFYVDIDRPDPANPSATPERVDVTRFFRGLTWTEDVDNGAASGVLRLRREYRDGAGVTHSLSPLVEASPENTRGDGGGFDPVLTPFRRFRVYGRDRGPLEAPVTNPDSMELLFAGVLDDPSFGGAASVVEVAVRDLGGVWQDATIEVARVYGSEAGTPIQDVQSQLLADNTPETSAPGVAVLGDPEGWSLRPFTQAPGGNVWEACRTLASQMGWDFRYWWTGDAYAPTLRKPRRDTDTADLVLTRAQILQLPRLVLNGTDVRNAGALPYVNAATGTRQTITREDAGSIARFKRRPFGLPIADNIDTADEAAQYLEAAVADLATPYLDQQAVLPFLPALQLGDVLEFPAGTGYDDAQRFGVSGFTHEVTLDRKPRTTVTLRGRPVGAYRRWLALARRASPNAAAGATAPASAAAAPPVAVARPVTSTATAEAVVIDARAAAAGAVGGEDALTFTRRLIVGGVAGTWSARAPVPASGVTAAEAVPRAADAPVVYQAEVRDERTGAVQPVTHVIVPPRAVSEVGDGRPSVDTQPLDSHTVGAFERWVAQRATGFTAARLIGDVLVAGDVGQQVVTDFAPAAGGAAAPLGVGTATPTLPVSATGRVIGPTVAPRPACTGDVLARAVLAARAGGSPGLGATPRVQLRNLALQWLRLAVTADPPPVDPDPDPLPGALVYSKSVPLPTGSRSSTEGALEQGAIGNGWTGIAFNGGSISGPTLSATDLGDGGNTGQVEIRVDVDVSDDPAGAALAYRLVATSSGDAIRLSDDEGEVVGSGTTVLASAYRGRNGAASTALRVVVRMNVDGPGVSASATLTAITIQRYA